MDEVKSRRLKVMKMALVLLPSILIEGKEHHYIVEKGLPEDTKIINVKLGWGDYMELLLESEKFDEVPLYTEVPEIEPVIIKNLPKLKENDIRWAK